MCIVHNYRMKIKTTYIFKINMLKKYNGLISILQHFKNSKNLINNLKKSHKASYLCNIYISKLYSGCTARVSILLFVF